MYVQVKDAGVYPYDAFHWEVLAIGNDPYSQDGVFIFNYEITSYPDFANKKELYWNNDTKTLHKWTESDLLGHYRHKVLLDMEIKAFEYTRRLDYRIRYYNDLVDRGSTLTTAMQNDKNNKQDASITAKNWVHQRYQQVNNVTTKAEIDAEYKIFLDQFNMKMKLLENVL